MAVIPAIPPDKKDKNQDLHADSAYTGAKQEEIISKNEMKNELLNQQANVTIRNFPETVENIRKKWKIKNGGNFYCFFTTDKNDNKIVLICRKIN